MYDAIMLEFYSLLMHSKDKIGASLHTISIVQNLQGQNFCRFLEPQIFYRKFESALALADVICMQKFFHKYSHGDVTAKVLSLVL